MRRFPVLSLLTFFIGVFFLIPPSVFAATTCGAGEAPIEGIGCVSTDVGGFFSKFYGIGLGLIGGVALLFIIIGGYFVLTSQGNAQRLGVGKSYIFYAIVGLLLAIFGYVLTTLITADILRIPGFS